MLRGLPRRLHLAVAALLVGAAAIAPPAGLTDAHSGKQSYLYVSLFDDGVDGRVEIPVADLNRVLDTDIPNDPEAALAAVEEQSATIREYVAANTSLGDGDGRWELDIAETGRILATESGPYVLFDFVVDEEFERAPDTFVAEFSVIIESDPERDALLIIENDWASATFANEGEHIVGFSVGMTEQTVEIESASVLTAVGEVRGLGTDAVRTGIDLLLTVAALALISLMGRGAVVERANAAEIARRSVRTTAAFTVGLTITLWAMGLGIVSIGERTAGIVIALTLATTGAAAMLARFRAIAPRALVGFAVLVGLAFGIGLGTIFVAGGLERRRNVLGLVAFEAGALVAIAVIVACVVAPMLLLRDTRWGTPLALGLGTALVGYGLAWTAERIADADWPIEEIANPLRVWPRNLVFVLIAIAGAAALRRIGHSSEPSLDEEKPLT